MEIKGTIAYNDILSMVSNVVGHTPDIDLSQFVTAAHKSGNHARNCSCRRSLTELSRFGTTVVVGVESYMDCAHRK